MIPAKLEVSMRESRVLITDQNALEAKRLRYVWLHDLITAHTHAKMFMAVKLQLHECTAKESMITHPGK